MVLGSVWMSQSFDAKQAEQGDVGRVCCWLPWSTTLEGLFCGDGCAFYRVQASYLSLKQCNVFFITLGAATIT